MWMGKGIIGKRGKQGLCVSDRTEDDRSQNAL